MIAMTTLSMAMLILFGLLLNGGVLAATVRDRHRALRDVNALMEQMAAMPIASIGTVFPHNVEIPNSTTCTAAISGCTSSTTARPTPDR
jgi:hypothetical protein